MELAERNPEINYIGIEKFSSVLIRALQKMEEKQLTNLVFIRMDAEDIEEVFEKEQSGYILLATFQTKVKRNTLEFCLYCAVLSSTGLHFRTAPGKISSSIVLLIVFRLANANYPAPGRFFLNTMPKSNMLFPETAHSKVLLFLKSAYIK